MTQSDYYRGSRVRKVKPPTASQLPAQVTGVAASDGTDAVVVITWDAAARATSYRIYRSTIAGQAGALIASVATLTITDVTALVGQTYYYSVVAWNSYGAGPSSVQDAGYVMTPPPAIPAESPTQALTTESVNPTDVTITVYRPTDIDKGRVWLTAPLRSDDGTYFTKWQRDGVDYDQASTTSLLLDDNYVMRAVYTTPDTAGVTVAPGTDTLAAAMVGKAAGTTYLLQAGIHRFTAAVSPRSGDTIQAENGVYVRGSKVITFTPSGGVFAATGQTQDFYASHGDGNPSDCSADSPLCYRRERVFFDGAALSPVGSLAALATGKFFFDYGADTIYIFDDPSAATVETTVGCGGFIGFGGSNINVTLRNLTVEQFGGGYVVGESLNVIKAVQGWRVENCEVRYCSATGIVAYYSAIVRNNYVHHCGQFGIVGSPALWEGNVIDHNNTDGYDPNNNGGGSKFLHSTSMSIRGNVFSYNYGTGIWSDYDNKTALYENNIIRGNTWGGLDNEANCFATVRYNVFDSNNAANASRSLYWLGQIYSSGSSNAEIYDNDITVGSGWHGISIRDNANTTPQCGTIGVTGISVHDNVVRLNGGLNGYVGDARPVSDIAFVGNQYIVPNAAGAYFQWGYSSPMTFAQWQAIGQDVSGSIST